jgi:hypothetical protein
MIIFDWRDAPKHPLERYVPDTRGYKFWIWFTENYGELVWKDTPEFAKAVRDLLNSEAFQLTPFGLTRGQPQRTVFISHRKDDDKVARKAAKVLTDRGINVWLDVDDPLMPAISATNNALLIALYIEMALVNSTHVLALMTSNTKGSLWIPYEYGRVKCSPAFAQEAASLHLENLYPEYTYLGVQHHDYSDLQNWP